MDKAPRILARAQELAQKCETWADLSNLLFDPLEGEIVREFPDPAQRAEFRKTPVYGQLHRLVELKATETGLVAGARPKKSGKFVVRLPRSLHAALESEAEVEGTSLNQLVLAKLAVQLETLATGRIGGIIQAFGEVRDGFSADRVIADPKLNRKFLRRCRELGLSGTDYDLNWTLMNARKSGELSSLPKTKRYTVRGTDEFEYASELGVRHMQRTHGVSLDKIICDPELAEEFDHHAGLLAPGFTPLQYRWCALGLRKAGRLKGLGTKSRNQPPSLTELGSVRGLHLASVPECSGLYLFSAQRQPVFLGQTENLQHRIERHISVSSGRGLPEWLWAPGEGLDISLASMPGSSRTTRRVAGLLLVRELKPVLNYARRVA